MDGYSIWWEPEEQQGIIPPDFFPDGCSQAYQGYPMNEQLITYRAVSQTNGGFLFENLPEGRYILTYYDPQNRGYIRSYFGLEELLQSSFYYSYFPYLPIRVRASEPTTTNLTNLIMHIGGKVSGRLTYENGLPLEGARVIARLNLENDDYPLRPDLGTIISFPSDQQGNYLLAGLPAGEYVIEFGATSYSSSEGRTVLVKTGEEIGEVNFTYNLGSEGAVFGTITDLTTGLPVPCAEIDFWLPPAYPEISAVLLPAWSSQDGTYRISLPSPGTYYGLLIDSPAYMGLYYPGTSDPGQALPLQLEAGQKIGPIDFQVIPKTECSIIRGRVIDQESGLPLAGLQVYCQMIFTTLETSSEPYPYSYAHSLPGLDGHTTGVITDSEGNFAFTGLRPGSYYLFVDDPTKTYLTTSYPAPQTVSAYYGYTSYSYHEYLKLLDHQTIENISISMTRGACLEGKVFADGVPLAGIKIGVQRVIEKYDGQIAYYQNYPSYNSSTPFSLSYSGADYYGGMLYGLPDNSFITDTSGSFTICGLDQGKYVVLAEQDLLNRGFVPAYLTDPNGGLQVINLLPGSLITEATISMQTGSVLTGQVVDPSGLPLENISVEISWLSPLDGEVVADCYLKLPSYNANLVQTKADGRYSFVGLAGGVYSLHFNDKAGKYLTKCINEQVIPSTGTLDLPVMTLSLGAVLSGRIVSMQGLPLPGISLEARREKQYEAKDEDEDVDVAKDVDEDEDQKDYYYAQTGADGCYRLTGLPFGEYTLRADDEEAIYFGKIYSSELYPGTITVSEGQEIDQLDFCLNKGGEIKGSIRDLFTGSAVAGLVIKAEKLLTVPVLDQNSLYSYIYLPDPNIYLPDPNIYLPDPNTYLPDPNTYLPDPNMYPVDPNTYLTDPNIYPQDPNIYLPDPNINYTYDSLPIIYDQNVVIERPCQNVLYFGNDLEGDIGDIIYVPVFIGTCDDEVNPDLLYALSFEVIFKEGVLEYQGFHVDDIQSYLTNVEVNLVTTEKIKAAIKGTFPFGNRGELLVLEFLVKDAQGGQCYYVDFGGVYAVGSDSTGANLVEVPFVTSGACFSLEDEPVFTPPKELDPNYVSLLPENSLPPDDKLIIDSVYYSSPSDESGEYIFHGLSAGTYLVSVYPKENYRSQYYAGASDSSQATSIDLRLNQLVEGIDFQLTSGLILRGTVRNALTNEPILISDDVSPATVELRDAGSQTIAQTSPNSLGEYQFNNLSPGSYTVHCTYSRGYHSGSYGPEPSCPALIEISQPEPTEGVDIFLMPKTSLTGRVIDEATQQPLGRIRVYAIPIRPAYIWSPSYVSRSAITDSDGYFLITDLDYYSYRILAFDPMKAYVAEYYDNIPLDQWGQVTAISARGIELIANLDFSLLAGENVVPDYSPDRYLLASSTSYYPYPYYSYSTHDPVDSYYGSADETSDYSSTGDLVYNQSGTYAAFNNTSGSSASSSTGETDTVAPVIICPDNLTVEAEGPNGVSVTHSDIQNFLGQASATDEGNGSIDVDNHAPEVFPLGETIVIFEATDSAQNSVTCSAIVRVVDTIGPDITCPDDILIEVEDPNGVLSDRLLIRVFLNRAFANDLVDGNVAVNADAQGTFPVGETEVTFSATDSRDNLTTCTAKVTIVDISPQPEISESLTVENKKIDHAPFFSFFPMAINNQSWRSNFENQVALSPWYGSSQYSFFLPKGAEQTYYDPYPQRYNNAYQHWSQTYLQSLWNSPQWNPLVKTWLEWPLYLPTLGYGYTQE